MSLLCAVCSCVVVLLCACAVVLLCLLMHPRTTTHTHTNTFLALEGADNVPPLLVCMRCLCNACCSDPAKKDVLKRLSAKGSQPLFPGMVCTPRPLSVEHASSGGTGIFFQPRYSTSLYGTTSPPPQHRTPGVLHGMEALFALMQWLTKGAALPMYSFQRVLGGSQSTNLKAI